MKNETKDKIIHSDNLENLDKSFKKKYSFISNLHPLTVVFFIIILVASATFIIPGGEFDRIPVTIMGVERETIVPGSFKYIESIPQGFEQIWTSFMEGAIEAADISFTIMLCTGAFTAIISTGAINNGINSLALKFGNKSIILIPIFVFVFGLAGATYGMYEDSIPFIMIVCPLMLALGYDSMVGIMTVHFSVVVGSSVSIINPFSIGIAQALAGVPMMSGAIVRTIVWFCMMTATSIYIMLYAIKIKKHPELSLTAYEDIENRMRYNDFSIEKLNDIKKRDILVIILTGAALCMMVYGVIKNGWWFNEIGSVFLFMGIIIPLIGGMKINEVINKNIEGMSTVISAVLLISASRMITAMLNNSKTMDTILHFISGILGEVPRSLAVIFMSLVCAVAMIFIQSTSGTAATLIPIMAPLADLLKIPRQTICSAFSMLSLGWLAPWEGINYAMCKMANIPFFVYLKKGIHFTLTVYAPLSMLILVLMTLFNFS